MARMTPTEVHDDIVDGVSDCHPDHHPTDNDGQLIVYTGIYRHADGSYHDCPESTHSRTEPTTGTDHGRSD